jgi:hypothetical protein
METKEDGRRGGRKKKKKKWNLCFGISGALGPLPGEDK